MNNKILVVADVHINDYANRNPSNRYRLYQGSRTVAQNIINAGKKYGCDTIVLAGDIVEKSVIRPYVQAEAKYFLDTVMDNFTQGFIIWGNHDLDSKSVDQEISDACLGVMLPKNLYYAHQKTINLGGLCIGFCNWMPEFDLTWVPGKLDVLFTHATICYSTDSEYGKLYESQKLDESKFDLAICGDIHKRGQLGKYVSIGCTQRCKLSDPEEASGVVVNCDTKSWEWVDLNPDNNLMKFKTTQNLEEEGWHESEQTWYVYKQENTLIGDHGKLKVDAWEEINELTENAIKQAGLESIHQEILKNIGNIDSGEVDFNFTLLHLKCENWRSIESLDIDFSDMDKILVQGANGSGKSSLLDAIKYALVDVGDTLGLTSLKPFVMFGKKDCFTEVTFLYQGNKCKIRRGTKEYGLWINDEQFKYNEKRAFEKDVRERFPFVRYLNAFFFNADKMSFLKSLTPEQTTEITSKFLKLNRLDTYHDTAVLLRDQVFKEASEWITKYKETENLLSYINSKLGEIRLPGISKENLIRDKEYGLELQRKNSAWVSWSTQTSNLQADIRTLTLRQAEIMKLRCECREKDIIGRDVQETKSKLALVQEKLVGLGNSRVQLDNLRREMERLRSDGNNTWLEAQSIGVGKPCPKCGQIIKTTEAMENHKNELLKKVENIRAEIEALNIKIQETESLCQRSQEEYQKLTRESGELNTKISELLSEIKRTDSLDLELKSLSERLENTATSLRNLGTVEQVDLPQDFMSKMSEIELGISSWDLYEKTMADKIKKEKELEYYKEQANSYQTVLVALDSYIKLTGPTGIIFEEIFKKLSEHFSSNEVKYVVERKGKGAREHLSLTPYYNNSGNWVNIQMCSSGQRIMLDLDYMSKIMGGSKLGICVLDEFLKPLDSAKLEDAIEILSNMNLGCLLLTSHAESIPAFYNRLILTSLNKNGKTDTLLK